MGQFSSRKLSLCTARCVKWQSVDVHAAKAQPRKNHEGSSTTPTAASASMATGEGPPQKPIEVLMWSFILNAPPRPALFDGVTSWAMPMAVWKTLSVKLSMSRWWKKMWL